MAGVLAVVESCSGRRAELAGKPSGWLAGRILKDLAPAGGPELEAVRGRTIMIGDRLDSDMALGHAAGIATLLVLTGCTTPAEAASAQPQPTFVATSLGSLRPSSRL